MPNCYCADRKLPLDLLPDKHRAKAAKGIDAQDARERKPRSPAPARPMRRSTAATGSCATSWVRASSPRFAKR